MSKASILEIEPKELKFIFELKKQSSCSVRLTNNTFDYVAFKVKTTSPKKYSVRPNVGVLVPKATSEFIVTMQAQREIPEDMVCKDKFLIQGTVVPAETTSDEVTSSLFIKDGSKYIEENKLKVTLISPPNSPDVSPTNGDFKNGLDHGKVQIYSKDETQSPEPMVLKNPDRVHEVLKLEEDMDLRADYYMGLDTMKDVEEPNEEAQLKVSKDKQSNMVKDVDELKPQKRLGVEVSKDTDSTKVKNAEELKPDKATQFKVSNVMDFNKARNAEELKPEKATELKVSKVRDLNKVKNAEEFKPENAGGLKVSEVQNLDPENSVKELNPETELKMSKDVEFKTKENIEELKPENVEELKMSKDMELEALKNVEELKLEKEAELRVSKSIEELKLLKAIEEMKLKLDGLESKLNESGVTISKLTEERRLSNHETKILQEKLILLIKVQEKFKSDSHFYMSVWWRLYVSSWDTVCTHNTVRRKLLTF
ncbi:vesicle-associated protein 2-2 isoform X1 [Vigna radiata var. radiata]|uniref:Vesicle-associated protein 2-2 isoform X1 n=1 Tax=Vigna radiata var. radiata TaxID=3916 RepID=A0A3Q0FA30_VIGRR|nr:vesicle-associated protein 2-2 isoform X1 [Vigna radiata var. radiata]